MPLKDPQKAVKESKAIVNSVLCLGELQIAKKSSYQKKHFRLYPYLAHE